MHDWLARPLSGLRFGAIGLILSVLKVALDFALSRAFGHPYSLLFYVDPLDAPLLHPGANLRYWLALGAATIPFIAVGVALTVRRLHDAALSSAYALLFFVPFAHFLFFVALVLAPSRPRVAPLAMPTDLLYREPGAPLPAPPLPPMRRYPRLLAAAFGAVVGLGALGISVGLFREYGAAFVAGSPTITGFAAGAFYARLAARPTITGAFGATILSMILMSSVVILFAIDGLFCMVVLFPIYLLPAILGAWIGYFAGRALPGRKLDAALGVSMMSFFAILALERVSPLPSLLAEPVRTSVEIDAPPERVWAFVPSVAEIGAPAPEDWAFRMSVAYPERAWMEGTGVAARRVCQFDTGTALETVDVWRPGHTLGFTVDQQPDPLRELTLYKTVRQPHNDGYVKNSRGELSLEALPGGRTRLTGTSWYEVRLAPEAYFRLWIDHFVHAIHGRVMNAIKRRAEGAGIDAVAQAP